MAKKKSFLVMLSSTGRNIYGNSTGTFKVAYRDPKKTPTKLSRKCYDQYAVAEDGKVGCHVVFNEKKMPPHSK